MKRQITDVQFEEQADTNKMPTRCERCGQESRVVDSRPASNYIRRRRSCLGCGTRWSTAEIRINCEEPFGIAESVVIVIGQGDRARLESAQATLSSLSDNLAFLP